MTREAMTGRGPVPSAKAPPGGGVLALVASGPGDAWLLPDDPFLNAGCRILRAGNQPEVSQLCGAYNPGLVFLPLTVAGEPSLGNLKKCLAKKPAPVVVVVASNDQINAAAEAMRAGAFDCLFKPFSAARLAKTVEAALKILPHEPAPVAAAGPLAGQPAQAGVAQTTRVGGMIAGAPRMRAALSRVAAVAPASAPVFITGEVGTGKSQVARMIHELSPRAPHAFVSVDCAALAPERAEAELFGPGGAALRAQHGTLLLDEICELDPEIQARLVRLVDAGRADDDGTRLDIRYVATTRHNPLEALAEGRLREDLYYRLHVAPIELPPLRERPGDAAIIARAKLDEFAATEGRETARFTEEALDRIGAYAWPGNVRELVNMVWSASLMTPGQEIGPAALPTELTRPAIPPEAPPPSAPVLTAAGLVGRTLAEIEREVIEATIRAQGGSVPRAARVLDVSPSTLYRKREAWEKASKG